MLSKQAPLSWLVRQHIVCAILNSPVLTIPFQFPSRGPLLIPPVSLHPMLSRLPSTVLSNKGIKAYNYNLENTL